MSENTETIAILGGTGDQGLGLALRFCQSGRRILIGSRKAERAVEAAEQVRGQIAEADVQGMGNEEATAAAEIIILSVPFEHTASTLKSIKESLRAGQIVVSMTVPLATAVGDGPLRTVGIWQGSAAELVKALVPKGVDVVSAFQNVSAHRLQHLAEPVECDVVVSGAKGPRQTIMGLCPLIPGLRALDGGPLSNARIVEEMTALIIGLNIRHKCPDGLGIRFTGLPE